MPGADSAKKLLQQFHEQAYQKFLLSSDQIIELPAIPSVFWIGATQRRIRFTKNTITPNIEDKKSGKVHFISKQNESYSSGFIWETTPEKLQEGVRWGIVTPESVSGRVIASLGTYRVIAHKRIAKGMMSNRQTLKLQLLDAYQDRLTALQALESLVNKDNTLEDYQTIITAYIENLQTITQKYEVQFQSFPSGSLNLKAINQFKAGIENDIRRARYYLNALDVDTLRVNNRARGHASIQEFVKQQMLRNLYELQGINQDLSYHKKRAFALTRGEFNDCIEEARQVIDDYDSDPRNAITNRHHGYFQPQRSENSISYDFSHDHLSAKREQDILLAISFIEGWDKLDYSDSGVKVVNAAGQEENLDLIASTRWHTHRNGKTFLRSLGLYLWTIIQGALVRTIPWIEESWSNPDFHLFATQLQKHVKPLQPTWLKLVNFLKYGMYAIVDVYKGIRNFGTELVIKMPDNIVADWRATRDLPSFETVLNNAKEEIITIQELESARLERVFQSVGYASVTSANQPHSEFATVPYHLTAGERNDILTAMVSGIDSFGSVFSTTFAKDPIAGLLFFSAYAAGGAVIFLPALSKSIFGAAYVNWFSNFSYAMGSSKMAASIAGGSTQAQILVSSWDILTQGPTSKVVDVIHNLAQDPLTVSAAFGVAYGLGYELVNGIAGHTIPGLARLKNDLGTKPEFGYPLIGGKFGIAFFEAFTRPSSDVYRSVQLRFDDKTIETEDHNQQYQALQRMYASVMLASWLNSNAAMLPKLKTETIADIARHIDNLYPKEAATSLKKLLYPETTPSIAFQLFSIPLTYITVILRFGVAIGMSLFAKAIGNPYPVKPIQQAGSVIANKILKDMSRLLVFSSELVHMLFRGFSSLAKTVTFTFIITTGRITSAFNASNGYSAHQKIAAVHAFFRTMGEMLYPASVIKKTVFAHPAHIIQEVDTSYVTLLQSLHSEEILHRQPKSQAISSEPDVVLEELSFLRSVTSRRGFFTAKEQGTNAQCEINTDDQTALSVDF